MKNFCRIAEIVGRLVEQTMAESCPDYAPEHARNSNYIDRPFRKIFFSTYIIGNIVRKYKRKCEQNPVPPNGVCLGKSVYVRTYVPYN